MKCIVKAGCLDNYILYTKPAVMNSAYGEYLRDLMKKKQADADFEIGSIKLQAWSRRNRRQKYSSMNKQPTVYMPAHFRAHEDRSQYFEKSPQDMTRTELQKLERQLLANAAGKDGSDPMFRADQEAAAVVLKEECLQLQPKRWESIKWYWQKRKF